MYLKNLVTLVIGMLIGGTLGTAVLGAAGIVNVAGTVKAAFTQSEIFVPQVGVHAAEISLKSLDGASIRLSQFRSKPVVINFWATWCPPCRDEMPLLQETAERYSNDLVVLGINFDEPDALVRSFVDEFGITFPILLDPGGQIGDLYRVSAFPTTIIVDEAGVIQVVHIGQLFAGDLDRYMTQLKVGQ